MVALFVMWVFGSHCNLWKFKYSALLGNILLAQVRKMPSTFCHQGDILEWKVLDITGENLWNLPVRLPFCCRSPWCSREDSSNTCHSLMLNLDMKLIVSNGFSSASESNYWSRKERLTFCFKVTVSLTQFYYRGVITILSHCCRFLDADRRNKLL